MVTSELLDFLRTQLAAGISRERLSEVLLAEGGWSRADLNEAFTELAKESAEPRKFSVENSSSRPQESSARTTDAPLAPKGTISSTLAERAKSPQSPVSSQSPAIFPTQKPPPAAARDPEEDFLGMFNASAASPPPLTHSSSTSSPPAHAAPAEPSRANIPPPTPANPPLTSRPSFSPSSAPLDRVYSVGDSSRSPSLSARSSVSPADISTSAEISAQRARPPVESAGRNAVSLNLAPGEDFLGIFSAYTRIPPAAQANPSPVAPPRQPEPTRPPIPPAQFAKTPSIVSELKQPEKVVPHHNAPSINVATVMGSRPIMSAPPAAKTFVPAVSKNLQPTRPLPPRPIPPPAPVSSPSSAGIAPSVAKAMLTEAERSSAPSAPRRVSAIAPPKRTFQDALARVGGRTPVVSASSPPLRPVSEEKVAPVHPSQIPQQSPALAEEMDSIEVTHQLNPGFPGAKGIFSRPGAKLLFLVILVIMPSLLTLSVLGAYFLFFRSSSTDIRASVDSLRSLPAFSYSVRASAQLRLGEESVDVRDVEFELIATGTVSQTENGIGNGNHSGTLSGSIRVGNTTKAIDLNGDVRVVDGVAYLHARSSPVEGKIDPEIMRRYWISVPLGEIGKEFSVFDGRESAGVRQFAGEGNGSPFLALLSKEMPFQVNGKTRRETIDGVGVSVIPLAIDPDAAERFLRSLMREKFANDLMLSEQDREMTRLSLQGASGELWVDDSGLPRKISLSFTPNGRVFGVPMTGTISLESVFAPLSGVSVTVPEEKLTVLELDSKMREFQALSEMRARDSERVRALDIAQEELEAYKKSQARYPAQFSELLVFASSSLSAVSSSTLAELSYYGYVSPGVFSPGKRCSSGGRSCPAYHIGISLEDPENPYLDIDADAEGEILGGDESGCSGESGRACLDRTQDVQTATTSESSLIPSDGR